MKEITLQTGSVTLVSDGRYDQLIEHRWREDIHNASRKPYVRATIRLLTPAKVVKTTSILMHRTITGCPLPYRVDHVDGDGLNNQDENLRIATQDQNNYNRRGFSLSGFKGVTRRRGRFQARITHLEVEYALGTYATAEEAARAYDAKAREFYGVFAYLNFPDAPRPEPQEIPF